MRQLRGNRIAMIFQDPMMTLNPVLRIDTQMIEAILAHDDVPEARRCARARDALARVGIPSPDERLEAYPHQFSGGMRQRVAIAIALLNRPDLIIADEPTTALDVTIQGQILYEVQKLARETGTALIWITHDLSVVAGLADRVCVMYAGRIVEQGRASEVLDAPAHPYTQGLLDSRARRATHAAQRLRQIPGMTPSLLDLAPGCAFRERCSAPTPSAAQPADAVRDADAGRGVRCHHSSCHGRDRRAAGRARGGRLEALRQVARPRGEHRQSLGAGVRAETVHAVDRVDLAIAPGEVVGLVGESGCGKSTLGRLAVGLLPLTEGGRLWRGVPHRRPGAGGRARAAAADADDLPGPVRVAQSAHARRRHRRRGAGRARHRLAPPAGRVRRPAAQPRRPRSRR